MIVALDDCCFRWQFLQMVVFQALIHSDGSCFTYWVLHMAVPSDGSCTRCGLLQILVPSDGSWIRFWLLLMVVPSNGRIRWCLLQTVVPSDVE